MKQFTAIALVFVFSFLMLNLVLFTSPVGASSEDWKIANIVGRFVNSEPTKPDQIFKIQYRVVNGTVENFRAPNEIIAEVNANDSGVLEIKFPRNYPYTNDISNTGGEPVLFINGQSSAPEYTATECFLAFSIPFVGNSEIGLVWSYLTTDDPYHGDNVPESCIDQAVVKDVPVKKNGTIRPLNQVRAGVAPEDVRCPEGMQVLVRPADNKPYCAPPHILDMLKDRWNIRS